jgi:hypothetical protein
MRNLLGGYLSATFNPLSGAPTAVEYLVVAGGGGGGNFAVIPIFKIFNDLHQSLILRYINPIKLLIIVN